MSQRWFWSLCLCARNVLVKMAKSFLKSDQLAFLYDLTCLGICLMRPRLTLISWNTISWSDVPNPGNVLVSWTWLSMLVRYKLSIFSCCFGWGFWPFVRDCDLSCFQWNCHTDLHVSDGDSFDQFMSGKLKSPRIYMWLFCGIFSTDDHNSFSECSSCSCGL